MIILTNTLSIIQYAEFGILLLHLMLLGLEVKSMKSILIKKETLSLLGFLFFLSLMRVTRVVGILASDIIIRTYFTGLAGLIATIFFVRWGSLVVKFSFRFTLLGSTIMILGMLGFLYARLTGFYLLEITSLLLVTGVLCWVMSQMFFYIFKTSPYVRARQRLFLLSISFILHSIFEVFIATFMGNEQFIMAVIVLGLTIPTRIGMTTSIILPVKVTEILSRIIH